VGDVEQLPLFCPDDDAEAFFHALLINDDVSRRGLDIIRSRDERCILIGIGRKEMATRP